MQIGYTSAVGACSDKQFDMLLDKIFNYCRTNIFSDTQSNYMTCAMLQSLVVKNAEQTLNKFIPWLHKNITTIVKVGILNFVSFFYVNAFGFTSKVTESVEMSVNESEFSQFEKTAD